MRRLAAMILPVAALVSTACGPPDPETLYVDLGCPRCHGFQQEGNRYGPTLKGLSEHWDSEQAVVTYLRNPAEIVENDPRLKAQDADYDLKMQPVASRSDEDLAVLGAWLLTKE
ncbi:MAG: c-type cytochrome [Acidobacteriota bacterium]